MNTDFVKLMSLWCKAHPDFYVYPYFKIVEQYDRKDELVCKRLTTYVDKGRVNYTSEETRSFDPIMSDSDCCKFYLSGIMKNKSFQDYFKTIKFDSFEELELKLTIRGDKA